MRKLSLAAAALTGAAFLLASPAGAQGVCGSREAALDYLLGRYQERPRAVGLAADGRLVEVLVAPSGSWTILVSRADGVSCVVATGEAWQVLPAPPEGPRS